MKRNINFSEILIHLTAAALMLFAFYKGNQASDGINWVFDKDMVRNISMAQSMLDGYPMADSIFYGESLWYNPFLPALTAAASKISGSTLIIANMKIGAYINLIVPIGFYLLLLTAFGARAALISLTGMLFVFNNSIPTYMAGTYSAVTYALHFAPGFFFLSLLFYIKGRKSGRPLSYILSGIMLGLACLAHTTAALILGMTYFFDTALLLLKKPAAEKIAPSEHRKKTFINFILVVFFSVLIASPLLYSILFKYHFKTLNRSPMRVIENILRADNIGMFIRLLTPHLIILLLTAAGFVFMFFRLRDPASRILAVNLFVVIILIVYSYILQIIPVTFSLPTAVPGLHYIQYLGFLEAAAFGLGTGFILDYIFLRAGQKAGTKSKKKEKASFIHLHTASIITVCFSAALFFLYKPQYLDRWDFNKFRSVAAKPTPYVLELNDWLVKNIETQAVMFEDDGLPPGIMMAARKMIINPAGDAASNTFVDYMKRWSDKNIMTAALENRDYPTLLRKFGEYHVSYIIENGGSGRKYWGSPEFMKKIYQFKQIAVYRVDYGLLKQAAGRKTDPSASEPYSILSDESLYTSASVFCIEDYQFNYLETSALHSAMKHWRWLRAGKGNISLANLLKNMKCGSIAIVKRKDLAALAITGDIQKINRSGFTICNFTSPKEFIKVGNIHPEKAIVFCGNEKLASRMKTAGANLFSLSDFIKPGAGTKDNEQYIKDSSLLVFNSRIYKKYLKAIKNDLESGKRDKAAILRSFIRQATRLEY